MLCEIRYSEEPLNHPSHTHVYYELLYVFEGAVSMILRGKERRVEAGSLVFLNPFDEHATKMIEPVYRRYYLLIPPNQFKAFHNDAALLSVFRFHGDSFACVLPTGAEKPRFDTYFALLLEAARRGGPDADTRVEALMTLLLLDARELRPDMFLPPEAVTFLPIQEILDELDQNHGQGFSLEALAERYFVSPGCLSAHFRRLVGVSPMQYAMQSRLMHAKLLLQSTERSVADIARQCGWQDTSNFVRRLRQQIRGT
ncbi:MAG: AraC family transcriptional regulator, partial [Clostridia bacterium]|nr:AraC family transcriptional regulator [Clostridia bacterium]